MELSPAALEHAARRWEDRGDRLLSALGRLADAPTAGFGSRVAPVAAGCADALVETGADLAALADRCARGLRTTGDGVVAADEAAAAAVSRLLAGP